MLNAELLENISKIVESCGAHLVDVHVQGGTRTRTLDVSVDTETGVDADRLAEINRALSDAADRIMDGTERYVLTVGSPGLEAPLRHDWQFRRHRDRLARIVYSRDGDRAERTGRILDCAEGTVQLESENEVLSIPLGDVIEAKIQIHL